MLLVVEILDGGSTLDTTPRMGGFTAAWMLTKSGPPFSPGLQESKCTTLHNNPWHPFHIFTWSRWWDLGVFCRFDCNGDFDFAQANFLEEGLCSYVAGQAEWEHSNRYRMTCKTQMPCKKSWSKNSWSNSVSMPWFFWWQDTIFISIDLEPLEPLSMLEPSLRSLIPTMSETPNDESVTYCHGLNMGYLPSPHQ